MSRRQKRLQDMRESKERRMKIVAIGGAVVLAALLAWELPHYLGGKKSGAPATTTTAVPTTPGTTTPGATAPGTAAAAPAAAPTASTKLPNSDVAPRRTKSQLANFSTFHAGDPFVPQISATTPSADGSAGSAAAGASPAAGPSAPSLGGVSTVSARQTSVRTLARAGSVTIAVNGKTEVVRVGGSFPSSNPVFKLVSLARGAANIGIANGSYTSGAHTVRLSSGRTLTLVDTADGVRYSLRLLS